MKKGPLSAAASVACLFLGASLAKADDKKFNWSYEAKTLPEGTWEFEQWATLEQDKASGHWTTLDLADEIEYGVTDRLNGAIYLHTFYQGNSGVPGFENDHEGGFHAMSNEWKYRLTDPATDLVGILLYEEPEFSNNLLEFETKLVLSKDVGPWTFAYNFIYEAELLRASDPSQSPQWTWEHGLWSTAGVSYSLSIHHAVGLEFVDVARYDAFRHSSTRADFVGPNVHATYGSWWATLTFLRQINFGRGLEFSDPDNTRFSVRFVLGVTF